MNKLLSVFAGIVFLLVGLNAQAAVVSKQIPYTHGGVPLEGYLAYDDTVAGQRPAVLIVHEWWGLNDYARKRADQFAQLGYVAFALDMYGKGKTTSHPEQAGQWMKAINANVDNWRQRAMAGLDILKRQAQTDPERVVAIGYCFGGATVQQLAYSGAAVKGVVSFHGSLIPPSKENADRVKAKILICHGAADPFIKPEAVSAYLAAMNNTGIDWQMIAYGGAKHSFTNPAADQTGIPALGYSPLSDFRSWKDMEQFFREIL